MNTTEVRMTLREFAATDAHFAACCKAAEIEPTIRQASKFLRGFGLAYTLGRDALRKKNGGLS